jgi:uncharacterized membrane protein/protein-disulfide isomerase
MKPSSRSLILAFAGLGLGASAMSSYVHYQLLTRPGYTSFCDVSSAVSCTQAYLSQYGSFWGVPVALGGVFYFAFVLAMAGIAGRPKAAARESAPAYIFAVSTIALAFVLYLAWASFFQLRALCLLCATTYVAVIAIFIISGGATPFPMTTLPRRAARDARALVRSPAALVMTLVLLAGTVLSVAAFPRDQHGSAAAPAAAQAPQYPPLTDGQRTEFANWYSLQPKLDVPIDAEGAKVLVVKFNDYQCPPCRQTYYDYKGILAKYAGSGQVRYVLKHFPIEGECNPPMAGGNHFAACEAAAAVMMAQSRGTAPQLEEWLFANQPNLTPASVRQAAAEIGRIPDFDAQYGRIVAQVQTDAGLGALLGAKSTPTFFINGRRIAGGLPPAYFEYAIELELKRTP